MSDSVSTVDLVGDVTALMAFVIMLITGIGYFVGGIGFEEAVVLMLLNCGTVAVN